MRFFQLLSVFLVAFLVSGCAYTRIDKRSQTIKVNTNPQGAQVWIGDDSGRRVIGQSPVSVTREYGFEYYEFNEWWWSTVAGSLALTIAGIAIGVVGVDGPDWLAAGLGGVGLVTSSIFCTLGQLKDGEEKGPLARSVVVGADLDGFFVDPMNVRIPIEKGEINLLLSEGKAPGLADQTGSLPPTSPGQIIAVFDVSDASKRFKKDILAQLTTYLGASLAQTGKFRVIPRDQLRARLLQEKKGTYRECFDEKCQIELGKAVAAQKTLATQILRVGNNCAVTASLFDLKTETADKAAKIMTNCSADALMEAMDRIADQLSR
ncbi:MAG: hypothetical protein JXR96_10190 [Deltaproteobacteria bacterium]|nr:hypothetical protein [Deltaproteobacteria bacterium]